MTDSVPERLGKYKIIKEVGRGGFAAVYKAVDTILDRTVALKVLASHLLWDPTFIQRFQREAKVAANLDHPNIVTIHEVSQIEGVYFIAMQFLAGRTLSQILKAVGPLPVSGVQAIIEQIASALDYAHARGLVHRDIKPSNVIVANDGRATLTDFGLVRAGEGTKLSTTGVVFGTPEYMSPEQAEGKVLDARSDIYSLGVVLYEMLAGRAPFVADTTPAVMYKHVHEPPPLEELPRDLPRGVVAVVEKALAKKREDRFASAGEMAAALKQAVSGAVVEEVEAPPSVVAPPSETLRPRAERVPAPPVEARKGPGGLSWLALGLFGLAVVILLVAVAVGGYFYIERGEKVAGVPTVVINSPPSGSQVQVGQDIIVQATATDSKGVTQVELWVNGVLHHSDVSPNPQGQSPFISQQSWRAPAAGTYSLMVRAHNAAGGISQPAAITVNVTGPEPGEPTATPTVTSTPAPGMPTATWTPVIVATDTPTPTPTVCTLDAAFVADVTVPDGTIFEPGARIDKIWRIRNSGNCPWDGGYTWVLVSGDQMGAPASQAVSATAAGGSVDIGVTMYAPSAPGAYTGHWRMKSPDEQVFGQTCSVQIVVPTPTPTPTPTPCVVTNVTANVAPSSFSGTCPKTFDFSANITVNCPGTVTYRWERSDGAIAPIESITFNAAGSQTVTDQWTLGAPGSHWKRVHVLTPNEVVSNQAGFTLSCDEGIDDFVGDWRNVDTGTGGMTRLVIERVDDNTVSFHGYGACVPTDCEWDTSRWVVSKPARVPFTPPKLVGTYEFTFKETRITVERSGNQLLAEVFDDYTESDGRTDQVSDYVLER